MERLSPFDFLCTGQNTSGNATWNERTDTEDLEIDCGLSQQYMT